MIQKDTNNQDKSKLFNNIVVVCVGNICRSPMAEALLIKALNDAGEKNHNVSSAGLSAMVGHKPDIIARQLMSEKGIDISGYKATQLNRIIIRKSDLILVMESGHKDQIENKEPSAKGKVFRLGEWGEAFDIPDPYKQKREAFENALELIEKGIKDWVKKI